MNSTPSLIILGCCLWTSGCHVLQCKAKDETSQSLVIASRRTVTVGGLVRNPGEVQLSKGVGTLGAALSVAGVNTMTTSATAIPKETAGQRAILDLCLRELEDWRKAADAVAEVRLPNGRIDRRDGGVGQAFDAERVDFGRARRQVGAENGFQPEFVKKFESALGEVLKTKTKLDKSLDAETFEAFTEMLDVLKSLLEKERSFMVAAVTPTVDVVAGDGSQALFVRLDRSGKRYYFPYSFVNSGTGGAIELTTGDMVTVVSMQDTVLHNPVRLKGGRISISGFTRRTGPISRAQLLDMKAVAQNSLKNFRGKTEQLCIVLRRREFDRVTQATFVFPYSVFTSSTYEKLATASEDRFEIVPYFQAPLVAESIIGRAAREASASRVDRIEQRTPVQNKHEKKMNWLQDKKQTMDQSFHNMMSNLPIGL